MSLAYQCDVWSLFCQEEVVFEEFLSQQPSAQILSKSILQQAKRRRCDQGAAITNHQTNQTKKLARPQRAKPCLASHDSSYSRETEAELLGTLFACSMDWAAEKEVCHLLLISWHPVLSQNPHTGYGSTKLVSEAPKVVTLQTEYVVQGIIRP